MELTWEQENSISDLAVDAALERKAEIEEGLQQLAAFLGEQIRRIKALIPNPIDDVTETTEDAEEWALYSKVAGEKDEEEDYWENGTCDNCHFPMRAHDDGDCPSSYEGVGRFGYEA